MNYASTYSKNPLLLDPRFAIMEPLTKSLFNHVVHMNRASQRYVFQRLAARFSRLTPRPERELLAVHAITTAMRELGLDDDERLPSNRYESWYEDLPIERQDGYPSASTIRRIFHNNWNDAIDSVVATPSARFLTLRMRARGKAFTNEEIHEAVRLFAKETPNVRSFRREWKPWARIKRAEGKRVPLAFHTVRQRFMSYEGLIEAAGAPLNVSSAVHALSDEEMREIIREADSETDGVLTWAKFIAWRKRKQDIDPSRAIPHHETIAMRIGEGDWAVARERALRPTHAAAAEILSEAGQ